MWYFGEKYAILMEKKFLRNGKLGMKNRKSDRSRALFVIVVLISFVAIYIFNALTPVMSDDLLFDGSQYKTVADIFIKEYERYLTWNGRSVLQIIMTISCLIPKWLFNICNSVCFVMLSLLVYWNIRGRKKYDVALYVLIQLFLWNFSVDFSQTVLWLSGACNYLWGITIILGFVTIYRYLLENTSSLRHENLIIVIMFPLGILAGWGNENTSGGAGLLLLIFSVMYIVQNKKVEKWMVSGMGGMAIGFAFLIFAPGNASRGAILKAEETYSGISAYISRGLKIVGAIEEHFMVYIAIIVLLGTYFYYTKEGWKRFVEVYVFAVAALATAVVLIMTPEPMARAYFGANIYMMIAALQMIQRIREHDILLMSLKTGIVLLASVWMCFVYVEEGANLVRILREVNEREEYILEQMEEGNKDLVLPMLRPQFETKYSFMYDSDISMEKDYWINKVYCGAYGLDSITAVPRDEWEVDLE